MINKFIQSWTLNLTFRFYKSGFDIERPAAQLVTTHGTENRGNLGGPLSKKSRRSEDMTDYSTSERHMRLSMLYGLSTTHSCPVSKWDRTILRSDPIGTRGNSIIFNVLTTKLVINSVLTNLSVLFLEPKSEKFFNKPYHLRLRGTFTSSLPPLDRMRSRFFRVYSG